MRLSIVTTLYRSAPHVDAFHARASAAARRLADDDYELVLVDDGSPDDSRSIALALTTVDPHVVLVDLSRNFGHHKAMMTGLEHARGDLVFLIDSDLEEDPAWLDAFAPLLRTEDCDVVFGVQVSRKGSWLERWTGAVFYRLMNAVGDVEFASSMVTARVMSRRYVDALLLHREHAPDIGGLWALTGFRQHAVPVTKEDSSPTTYTLRRRVGLLVNSLTSFSSVPLVGILCVGVLLLGFAVVAMAVVLVRWLALGDPFVGATALVASVWFVGALIVTAVGIVGVYLAKVLAEVRERPYTIVREVHGRRRD